MYHPNQEKEVVIGCGCIVSPHGAFRILGSGIGKEYQSCESHSNGPAKWGLWPILRQASVYELIQWHSAGIPAPKRRSTRTPNWMHAMPSKPKPNAYTKPKPNWDHGTLF